MKRFIQRSLIFVLILLGLGLMTTSSLALIVWMLLGTHVSFIERFACDYKLTTACVIKKAEAEAQRIRDEAAEQVRKAEAEAERIHAEAEKRVQAAQAEVAAAEERVRAKEAELADLEQRKAELQDLHDRLSNLDKVATSYAVFTRRAGPRYVVTTGIGYNSLLNNTLESGWCYMSVPQGRSNDFRQVTLRTFKSDKRLKDERVSTATLSEIGLDGDALEEHRRKCVWPEGVS